MRSEEHIRLGVSIGNEKGVLHVAGRMVGWKVEHVEVEVVEFNFRTGSNTEAHVRKNLLHLAKYFLHRVLTAGKITTSRQCQVNPFAALTCSRGKLVFCFADSGVSRLLEFVEQLADPRFFSRFN